MEDIRNRIDGKPGRIVGFNDMMMEEDVMDPPTKREPSAEDEISAKGSTVEEKLAQLFSKKVERSSTDGPAEDPDHQAVLSPPENADSGKELEKADTKATAGLHPHYEKSWNDAENDLIRKSLLDLDLRTSPGRQAVLEVVNECNKIRNAGSPPVTSRQLMDQVKVMRFLNKTTPKKRRVVESMTLSPEPLATPSSGPNPKRLCTQPHEDGVDFGSYTPPQTRSTNAEGKDSGTLKLLEEALAEKNRIFKELETLRVENRDLRHQHGVLVASHAATSENITNSTKTPDDQRAVIAGLRRDLAAAEEKVKAAEAFHARQKEMQTALSELVLEDIQGTELRRKILGVLMQQING